MRVVRLVLLGLVCYLIGMLVFFPAAPVVNKLRPQLGPVALEGVSGPLARGTIARVASTDDLLPLEASNVRWRLAPTRLLSGGAARIDLDAYDGQTSAIVTRRWNGDIEVSDLELTARAKALEPLLPAPIAAFDGALSANIATLLLENNLLTEFDGEIEWDDAVLERPIAARFGTVRIVVEPNGDGTHSGTFSAAGGDVTGNGSFTLAQNGDYTVDVQLTAEDTASAALVNNLSQLGRPDSAGRYRIQQSGNVNRLM